LSNTPIKSQLSCFIFDQYPLGGLLISYFLHHFSIALSVTLNCFAISVVGIDHTNLLSSSLDGLFFTFV